MAVKLGSLLLRAGVVTEDQLEEALQSQVMFGGRLGTNLIELGFLTEETLARVLGEQLRIPFCSPELFRTIPEGARNAVPRELVVKHQAVPVQLSGKQLSIAMIDPGNLRAVDEISFATNLKVIAMVAPESQVLEALETYYGVRRQSHPLKSEKSEATKLTRGGAMDFFEPAPAPAAAPAAKSAAAQPPPPPPAPPVEATEFPQLNPGEADSLFPLQDIAEVLTEARTKEDIFQAILSPFMEFFERYALFINKADVMVGHEGSGEGFSKDKIETLAIPLKVPSIFRDTATRRQPYFGAFPETHNNLRIANLVGRSSLQEYFLLCPIPLVQRVGVMIYADGCKDKKAVGERLEKFSVMGAKAGLAFQVLVLKQKILVV